MKELEMMSDEELRQAISNGFANPLHLDQLLKRTDLPLDRQLEWRANLSKAITYDKLSKEALQRFISQLSKATSLDQFDQVLAELRYANRLVETAAVAKESPIITGAKLGPSYQLGATVVLIDPVPEADALYLGADGLIHLDEVKNTANALRNKLNKNPNQLKRMQKWREDAPDKRQIRIYIDTEVGWTDLFARRPEEKASALQILIEEGVPLTIGKYNLSVAKMNELWLATRRKVLKLRKQKTRFSWSRFYRQMSTLVDAQKFLGISLS